MGVRRGAFFQAVVAVACLVLWLFPVSLVAEEVLSNGDFEVATGGIPEAWSVYGGTLSRVSAPVEQGSYAAAFTSTAGTGWIYQTTPAIPAITYTLRGYGQLGGGSSHSAFLQLAFYNSAGYPLLQVESTGRILEADGRYHLLSTNPVRAPASTTTVRAKGVLATGAEPGVAYFDTFSLLGEPHNKIQGQVKLQGRTNQAGAQVALGRQLVMSAPDGAFSLAEVMPGSFTITVSAPGYLSAYRSVTVTSEASLDLPPVLLLGGDGDGDGVIRLEDLVLEAAYLGQPSPSGLALDVNGDGRVDIYDIALTGINFGGGAPSPWRN